MMPARAQQGFTLLEILLVTVLMAMMATAAVLSIPATNDSKKLEQQTRQLAALLQFAQERALMTGFDYGLQSDDESYRFLRLSKDGWVEANDRQLRATTLDEGTYLQFELGDWQQSEQGFVTSNLNLFDGEGLLEKDFIVEDEDEQLQPQVMILSSGEMTPFYLTLSNEDESINWQLQADDLGRMSVQLLEDAP